MTTEGAVDGLAFEIYLKHFLLPALKAGQIVVMDNLSVHKSTRVKELIEQKGAALLFLPPYSPDFNPIEGVFSKLKGILRKAEARTQGVLVEAMGRALSAISRQDIAAFFAHYGYRLPLQLL